jgi:hypothetical protein
MSFDGGDGQAELAVRLSASAAGRNVSDEGSDDTQYVGTAFSAAEIAQVVKLSPLFMLAGVRAQLTEPG